MTGSSPSAGPLQMKDKFTDSGKLIFLCAYAIKKSFLQETIMANQSVTPADIFADLLRFRAPAAIAWVRGGDAAPNLSGLVKFYQTPYSGVLVEAEIFNLPNKQEPGSTDFYAMHIHQNGDCSDDFTKTGDHYNPSGEPHPDHAGDLLPLLGNEVMPGFPSMTSASPQMTLSAGPSSFTVMPTTLHPSPQETPGPKSDVVSLKKRII